MHANRIVLAMTARVPARTVAPVSTTCLGSLSLSCHCASHLPACRPSGRGIRGIITQSPPMGDPKHSALLSISGVTLVRSGILGLCCRRMHVLGEGAGGWSR